MKFDGLRRRFIYSRSFYFIFILLRIYEFCEELHILLYTVQCDDMRQFVETSTGINDMNVRRVRGVPKHTEADAIVCVLCLLGINEKNSLHS